MKREDRGARGASWIHASTGFVFGSASASPRRPLFAHAVLVPSQHVPREWSKIIGTIANPHGCSPVAWRSTVGPAVLHRPCQRTQSSSCARRGLLSVRLSNKRVRRPQPLRLLLHHGVALARQRLELWPVDHGDVPADVTNDRPYPVRTERRHLIAAIRSLLVAGSPYATSPSCSELIRGRSRRWSAKTSQ